MKTKDIAHIEKAVRKLVDAIKTESGATVWPNPHDEVRAAVVALITATIKEIMHECYPPNYSEDGQSVVD